MLEILEIGMKSTLEFRVKKSKTVPFLYPESPEFQEIPEIFATGYMVGLMEWCCIRALSSALEDGEGSLGTLIDITHSAPTLPGSLVRVEATIAEIHGKKIVWKVIAADEIDQIGEGKIGRTVVTWQVLTERLEKKKAKLSALPNMDS